MELLGSIPGSANPQSWSDRGLIGPKKTANEFGDFVDFLGFLMSLWRCLWVLIIPKCLINDSGWIPILFGTFLELPKM